MKTCTLAWISWADVEMVLLDLLEGGLGLEDTVPLLRAWWSEHGGLSKLVQAGLGKPCCAPPRPSPEPCREALSRRSQAEAEEPGGSLKRRALSRAGMGRRDGTGRASGRRCAPEGSVAGTSAPHTHRPAAGRRSLSQAVGSLHRVAAPNPGSPEQGPSRRPPRRGSAVKTRTGAADRPDLLDGELGA